jgi:hypothetical protein
MLKNYFKFKNKIQVIASFSVLLIKKIMRFVLDSFQVSKLWAFRNDIFLLRPRSFLYFILKLISSLWENLVRRSIVRNILYFWWRFSVLDLFGRRMDFGFFKPVLIWVYAILWGSDLLDLYIFFFALGAAFYFLQFFGFLTIFTKITFFPIKFSTGLFRFWFFKSSTSF